MWCVVCMHVPGMYAYMYACMFEQSKDNLVISWRCQKKVTRFILYTVAKQPPGEMVRRFFSAAHENFRMPHASQACSGSSSSAASVACRLRTNSSRRKLHSPKKARRADNCHCILPSLVRKRHKLAPMGLSARHRRFHSSQGVEFRLRCGPCSRIALRR